MDDYKSIQSTSEGLYKESGSRFISLAFPVETAEEVKAILTKLRAEYHDARHVCFAYRIGADGSEWRSSDDGEPSGTAGRQILGQIDSAGLSDVLVVVVRYFGGILLGVPGLIRAYKTSSSDALGNAVVVPKVSRKNVTFVFDYLQMNQVMSILKDSDVKIIAREQNLSCTYTVSVRASEVEDFKGKISKYVIEII
ncbi:MAG: YigZ family protein [Bacteroidales bacterium]|nr:YigZ family protein [Bacteroidales bacterium]